MKKAFADIILLGFVLVAGVIALIGTVSDQDMAINKSFNLKTLSHTATRALAKHYIYNENMSEAEEVSNNILSRSKLGAEVVSQNLVTYTWTDTSGDGNPNVVTTTIQGYVQDNFWFRFFKVDTFSLPKVETSSHVTKEESDIESIVIRYGGSNAGYFNMVGTYELDDNGCIRNPQLILANKTDYDIGDKLGQVDNIDTRFFVIANGYNLFGNQTATEDSSLSVSGCIGEEASVTIDNITNAAPTYFQDTSFNNDNGYDHMHEIGKTYFDDYEAFINTPIEYCSRYRRGSCREWSDRDPTWEDWDEYATNNGIDYNNDPNDEYIITMEDLPDGGDKDFNDINLDTTKVRIPRSIDTDEISGDEVET